VYVLHACHVEEKSATKITDFGQRTAFDGRGWAESEA